MSPEARGPSRPRRVVVLRHGETGHNVSGIWQGQLDTELSERGLSQAEAAAPVLAALHPTRVVSSDLSRALTTARALGRVAGLEVETDERLRETHVGAWQGLSTAQVVEGWPDVIAARDRGEDFRRGDHGETLAEVGERVGAALTEHLERLGPGECLVVSTHGASGRVAVAWLVGLDADTAFRVLGPLGNAHWAELVEGQQGWRIRAWNASSGHESIDGTPPP